MERMKNIQEAIYSHKGRVKGPEKFGGDGLQ